MRVSSHIAVTLSLILSLVSLSPVCAAPAKKAPAKKSPAPAARPAQASGSSAAFNSYANQLRQKMGSNWNYPSGDNHVTLTIQVGADGSVSDLQLSSSPKNTEAEQKANDAFNSAQPLQALPSGITAATITCLFDSKADQWDSKANISVKIDPAKQTAPANNSSSSASDGEEKK